MIIPSLHPLAWERAARAVEKVRERLVRAIAALETAGVAYAVIGGNAVAAWVATLNEGGVRNTPNVDLLLRRADLPTARAALERARFLYGNSPVPGVFLDEEGQTPRTAVRIFVAGEKVRPEYSLPAPAVSDVESLGGRRFLKLDALLCMKLTAFRLIDRVHVRDMLDVGLIDATWLPSLPPELATRLQHLLETPDG
jgi:hypothetical protein